MKIKKYVSILIISILVFLSFHISVWFFITKKIFQPEDGLFIGDLGRMSYKVDSYFERQVKRNLLKKYKIFIGLEQVDVITIGDSISNGGGGGLNPYYQDYIASIQDLNVLNINALSDGYIETILALNNNRILDALKPKVIIIESIERASIGRFSKQIDWDYSLNQDKMIKHLKNKNQKSKIPNLSFINNLNYNAFMYFILYYFDDNAIFSKVYISDMSKELFSVKNTNKLLFFKGDLKYIDRSNKKSIALLNKNFNTLQKILKKKNIRLYFMPAVDKYNLYSKYIIDNKYKKSNFFELLRKSQKDYALIDTKKNLKEIN